MNSANPVQYRIETLRADLHRHNYLYHVLGEPEITDSDYDTLYQQLGQLEMLHPQYADPNSPTARVGGLSSGGFNKVRHERRMLSLENAFTAEEVLQLLNYKTGANQALTLEPKIDGLSLKLIYAKGRLVQAITRGDGSTGDDVTDNARTLSSLPLVLSDPVEALEVTGEVYMAYSVFNQLNAELHEKGDALFANARNAAAGTLKLKDAREVRRRRLSFVAHGIVTEHASITRFTQAMQWLNALGFVTTARLPMDEEGQWRIPPREEALTQTVAIRNLDHLRSMIAIADTKRKKLGMATDGLVFKYDSFKVQRELGEGTKAPKWACAYKFPPERMPTRLVSIIAQVGKTGKITPVAELEPVRLGGTVVKRASLFNQDEIDRLGVNPGMTVFVEKSAEIIPRVVDVKDRRYFDPSSKRTGTFANLRPIILLKRPETEVAREENLQLLSFKMPSKCPCCLAPLVRHEGFVDSYCENPECSDQVFQRLCHATGKSALDIDGCGDVMVRALLENGVRTLSQLFALEDAPFLKKAAKAKFLVGREKAKEAPLWRKLHALCIEGIGSGLCQDLAARWPSLLAMLDHLDEVENILGPVRFGNFSRHLDKHAEEIEALEKLGFLLSTPAELAGPLSGKVFVITGALESGTRDAVIRLVEKAGGTVKPSVSKKIDFLVMGEDAGATKSKAAQKNGVPIITEAQLFAMMGLPMTPLGGRPTADQEE